MSNGEFPLFVDVWEETKNNQKYRNVIWTGKHSQLVYMSLGPGEDIHWEMHHGDQHFGVIEGMIEISIGKINGVTDETFIVNPGDYVIIPAETFHCVKNVWDGTSKIHTVYSPPQH